VTDAHGGPFTGHDLDRLTSLVVAAWSAGRDRDWSRPAGTVAWTCTRTAAHAGDRRSLGRPAGRRGPGPGQLSAVYGSVQKSCTTAGPDGDVNAWLVSSTAVRSSAGSLAHEDPSPPSQP
jgi:hypothetical protein